MERLAKPQDIVIIVTSSEFLTMAPSEVRAQLEQLCESAHLYKTTHN